MGIGVLYAKRELLEQMPPFLCGGEMIDSVSRTGAVWAEVPHKFEAGTVNGAGAYALAEAIRLNDRAMFSSHALTQEQRESALKFYADTQGSLKKNVKWYHRVWIKWIQCLY